ncbi:cytochrome bc complex cytochrome b subunit [Streptomyces luteireticuli]|uniref:cytochrome bc1 complex cytochrome b subunit n=1 Tax=Streptomyces luteireticuli TaxID=173858 RepID=UPI0035573E64
MLFARRTVRLRARARQAGVLGYAVADRRAPVSEAARALLRKAFPDHWSFLLGEIALYSVLVLLLTGGYLTLFFEPGMTEQPYTGAYGPLRGRPVTDAYASVLRISFEVRGGLLIRQMHHWAALVFVAALGVHMFRVFFTGAFRRPRELNWVIGATLFLLGLMEGFCGYSLPDDLLSGTGMRTANTIVMSIPVVGTYLSFALWSGPFPGRLIIPRLYIVHVLFVPGLLLALIGAHLLMVVYLKHTQWAGRGRTNRNAVGSPMFPQFAARSAGLGLMVSGVLAALGGLAQINPVWDFGPYRPDHVSTDAQPDWYMGFLEGALRLMPPWENAVAGHTVMWNVLLPAVVLPGLLFLGLVLYPVFERWVTGDLMEHHLCDRPRDRPTRTALGVAVVVFYAVLLAAGGDDVIAFVFRASLETLTRIFQVTLLAGPVLAFLLTKRLCLALQARDARLLAEGEESGLVGQNAYGGIGEKRHPLPAGRRRYLLAREMPLPAARPGAGAPRRERIRAALSAWYYRDRVPMPADAEELLRATGTTAAPLPRDREE